MVPEARNHPRGMMHKEGMAAAFCLLKLRTFPFPTFLPPRLFRRISFGLSPVTNCPHNENNIESQKWDYCLAHMYCQRGGLTVAKPLTRLFDLEEWDRRPILFESVLFLIALGAVFVVVFVFLDLRASTLMNLFES